MGEGHFDICVELILKHWLVLKIGLGGYFFFCLKGVGVFFGIKTRQKGLKTSKWLQMTSRNFCIFSKNMGMLHIKWKLVIRVTHWKWENGTWRSSEVIRGQKSKKHKIFDSTLFMQGAFGTLNKERGLLLFCSAAYILNYIELSKKIALWPLNDLKTTSYWLLKSQNWPQVVFGALYWGRGLLFSLFSSLSIELHLFLKKNSLDV